MRVSTTRVVSIARRQAFREARARGRPSNVFGTGIASIAVTVIVPAFGESDRIERVLRTMPPMVDAIVVVDDASLDGTAEVARRAAARSGDLRITVIEHAVNRGVGAAIVTGYRNALAAPRTARDAFVVMAGDGQMDPRDLPVLVFPIAEGTADYVKGNRFLTPAVDVAMPFGRRIGGRVFGAFTAFAVGTRLGDSQCGYTAISRAACAALDLGNLYPRYGFPNDILGQLGARELRIREVPVRSVYAGESSGLRITHLPRIAYLVARAAYRCRVRA
jgi:glycosyltransferase involved in cell wall biosynthesis